MAHSYWEESASRYSAPTLHGDIKADVAVVGGGLAGLVTAYLLKQRGRNVVLLERGAIASGETAHTSAHLTALTDRPYHNLLKLHGKSRTARVWESGMFAIGLLEKIARDEEIDCDFLRVDGIKFAPSPEHQKSLALEREALYTLGISLTERSNLPFEATDAFSVADQARFHPLKFAYGLAQRIHGDGSYVFSHTPVTASFRGRLRTPGGTVRAEEVVFATHTPVDERVRMHTKLTPYQTYIVAIPRQHALGDSLYYDTLSPYQYIRNHGDVCIIGGADHETGTRNATGRSYEALTAYARKFFGDVEILKQWSGEVFVPADGLPYLGRRGSATSVITGQSGTGLTWGALGASIVADEITGEENAYAELYDPARLSDWKQLALHNLKTAYHYGRYWAGASSENLHSIRALRYGEGIVVRKNGRPVAVSKSHEGEIRTLSGVCTHAGGVVQWNEAEQTWDCPCHGSRFTCEGAVRSGPAKRSLRSVPLPAEEWERPPEAEDLAIHDEDRP